MEVGLLPCLKNWGILHQGIHYLLDLDLKRSIKRLESDQNKRPLLTGDDLAENFSQIYESRKRIYLESDLRIEVEDQSPYEVATMIAEHLPSILIDPETQAERYTTEL